MSASIRLIVNPSAGGGKAGRVAPEAVRCLGALGLSVRRADTRDLAHARELAAEAAAGGEVVVAVSGDGMVGEIADVLRDIDGAVLGIVPGGRGNDLARVLGIPTDTEAACALIADGHTRLMDLGLVCADGASDGHAYVCIASVGFDSDANRIANEAPAVLGGLVYAYGALRALLGWRPARFEIELDPPGERLSYSGYSVGFGNSKAYGGGMFATPGAVLDDGLLEVVVCESVSKLGFLTRVLPKVFRGSHVNEPFVHNFKAREVRVAADRPFAIYADGDPLAQLPVRVRALPGAIAMLTPRGGEPAPAGSPWTLGNGQQ